MKSNQSSRVCFSALQLGLLFLVSVLPLSAQARGLRDVAHCHTTGVHATQPGSAAQGSDATARAPAAASRFAPRSGLFPSAVDSAEHSYRATSRAADPVVDPVLETSTTALGTAAGTALGILFYPPIKLAEHLF
jgi:hypothetical protein